MLQKQRIVQMRKDRKRSVTPEKKKHIHPGEFKSASMFIDKNSMKLPEIVRKDPMKDPAIQSILKNHRIKSE